MWLYRTTRRLRPVLGMYWDVGLAGAVHLVPPAGPLLVASNHVTFLDPWCIGLVFPRPVRYLINRPWYERSRLWRTFFDANGTLPIEADDPRATIQAVCRALADGQAVGVFPEGGISRDGELGRFRHGLSSVAAISGAPVIPLALVGAHELFPRTRRVPRPGHVTVQVGSPLSFPDAPRTTPPEPAELRRFTAELRAQIARLADESRAGAA